MDEAVAVFDAASGTLSSCHEARSCEADSVWTGKAPHLMALMLLLEAAY